MSVAQGQKSVSGQLKKIVKLGKDNLVEWTDPNTEQSSNQKHLLVERVILLLILLFLIELIVKLQLVKGYFFWIKFSSLSIISSFSFNIRS
jgi:hypothetical protein